MAELGQEEVALAGQALALSQWHAVSALHLPSITICGSSLSYRAHAEYYIGELWSAIQHTKDPCFASDTLYIISTLMPNACFASILCVSVLAYSWLLQSNSSFSCAHQTCLLLEPRRYSRSVDADSIDALVRRCPAFRGIMHGCELNYILAE